MADEDIIEQPSESEKRIKQLSEKVRTTSEERDEKNRLLEEGNKKIAELERENTFNSSFVDILGTQPAAKDHKDEIKAKVLAGYSPEDAAFAVLGKAGKLGTLKAPEPQSPAGGSAANTITAEAKKAPADMTQAEKRAELDKIMVWS